jgi:hypothetical protein
LYTKEHDLNGDDHAYTTPVYYRKAYEMKRVEDDYDKKYYVREMEKTEQYQYVKIVDALLKMCGGFVTEVHPLNFYKSEKEKYFEIEVLQGVRRERYTITLVCLRIENKD